MQLHIDWLVQERRNSSALAMELRLSCTNPSISIHVHFLINFEKKNAYLKSNFHQISLKFVSEDPVDNKWALKKKYK